MVIDSGDPDHTDRINGRQMNAKDYLSQYRHMVWLEQEIEQEIDALRTRYIGKAITYSDMPTAHNSERDLSDYIAQLDGLLLKLQHQKMEAISVYQSIEDTINHVVPEREQKLLRLRYLRCMTWEEVAEAMDYDVRWVYKIHGDALEIVDDLLNTAC